MSILWTILPTAGFVLLAGRVAARWLSACAGRGTALPADGAGQAVETSRRELRRVFAAALLFRGLVLVVGAVVVPFLAGEGAELSWLRWDAHHYIRLVELGYAGYVENGQNLFLVFFPLYVWIVRAVAFVVRDVAAAGMLVSTLCYAGGCVYVYRLGVREYGRKVAQRALLYLSLYPFAFFFGGVMTEGLFFLTTAAALWHIREHRYVLAGLWGLLAAMTRMHGVLLIAAAGVELLEHERVLADGPRGFLKKLPALLRRVPALLLPLLGTAAYLGLNYHVTGDPFSFATQQKHWHQGFLWFSEVLRYLWRNTMSTWGTAICLEMWLPEVVLFVLFAALLVASVGRHRSFLVVYALACLTLNYSLSWLLSAGRYLSCALPFFLFAAARTEGRPWLHRALCVLSAALFVGYLTVYLAGGQVM